MEEAEGRPRIEVVRVPSIDRRHFRPLDGVQLRATYSHVRVGTYCPEPEPEPENLGRRPDLRPPVEQSRKYKKNLGPVSRLLRRRHHATSLATKSCDNIYSVNKSNSFFEWKHGNSGHGQGRQSNSLDWHVGRRIEKNSSDLEYQKASRSAEQLSRSGNLHTPSTKSKIVSLLRRLSPRLTRPNSKGSLPTSPSICPWVQVEYSSGSCKDATDGATREDQLQQSQDMDYSFQRELQLTEMRKRAIKASNARPELAIDSTSLEKCKRSPRSKQLQSVQIQGEPSPQAVHEERGSSEERRQTSVGSTRLEVARVPVESSGHAQSETSPVPRSSNSRRSRPHSLAVQPLHYQRLDPEQPLELTARSRRQALRATDAVAPRHTNMTSQESIGSCSLDVERSASDRSDVNAEVSLSERTLHSLNLSNGEDGEQQQQQQQQPVIRVTREEAEDTPISNGHQSRKPDCTEQLTPTPQKKPSYLGLACSISGYTGITRYDSKLREGFRSRDSSPGARLINRDTSPAGFRSNELANTSLQSQPPKSQSISPLAMERHQNGFANGVREKSYKIESYIESGKSTNFNQEYSEVDRGVMTTLHSNNFPGQLSPIRASSPNKRSSPVGTRVTTYNQQNKLYSSTISSSSPKSYNISVSRTSCQETGALNGSSGGENELNTSASSEKSFIQQRVERLYGPGALAQGFFFKRSHHSNKLNTSDSSNESTNNNNTSVDDLSSEDSLKNLPVLRHLRPEFRAQLPVVSPRKPTDGTEQIIKPLKRISLSQGKNDTKETKAIPPQKESNTANDSKMTASATSLTDQQPAAPKVVLPVLEPSSTSTNIPKQGKEELPEKDGHYFTNLLNKERNRLIALAKQAEAELEDNASLPEEAAGKLRSGAGKARLLATQKMKQFEGLCQKNINQVPGEEFPTTSEDLAGFWDMVMLQVVQVNDLFDLIDRSRKSQWQEIVLEMKSTPATPQNGSAVKRRQTSVSKTKSVVNTEAARKAREAREQTRRQLLEEKRRAMRSNSNKADSSVEIFVPET